MSKKSCKIAVVGEGPIGLLTIATLINENYKDDNAKK
jgi:hypothetical protein